MDGKTATKMHRENLDAIQRFLNQALEIAKKNNLPIGKNVLVGTNISEVLLTMDISSTDKIHVLTLTIKEPTAYCTVTYNKHTGRVIVDTVKLVNSSRRSSKKILFEATDNCDCRKTADTYIFLLNKVRTWTIANT